ncbi:MAG: AraC family ligand binding domain-containing protein [Acidobacteriales bacterium]|nr:AraC family ligand binding domain-containing protein [Terriglobales bacterium]
MGEVRRRLVLPGATLIESSYPRGTQLPRHCHETAHFCLVMRGSYTEEIGSDTRDCVSALITFHPPGETHAQTFVT